MTIIARRIMSEPVRTASETWEAIVALLTPETNSSARDELLAIIGIACSLIVAEAMKDAPIVVYGSGPRIRIYCLYGEDAIIGEDANEVPLGTSSLHGNWAMSLPCPQEDLEWIQGALEERSSRISARELSTSVDDDSQTNSKNKPATINVEAFLRP